MEEWRVELETKKKVLIVGELNVDIIGVGLQTFPVLGREITAQEMVLSLGVLPRFWRADWPNWVCR